MEDPAKSYRSNVQRLVFARHDEIVRRPPACLFIDAFTAVNEVFRSTSKPGEILGLLGPNGSGTTTTIQMLLGDCRVPSLTFAATYLSLRQALKVEENLWIAARVSADTTGVSFDAEWVAVERGQFLVLSDIRL